MYDKIKVGDRVIAPIDWEMTPDLTFGTYESWGGRERVRNNGERVYYFFVDAWEDDPKVFLMERGVKYAKVLAEVSAPEEIVQRCVDSHGRVARFERTYAVDNGLRNWLLDNVLNKDGSEYVRPIVEKKIVENMGAPLPKREKAKWGFQPVTLPQETGSVQEGDIGEIIRQWNFYDTKENTSGSFANGLVDPGDNLTIVDERTNLQWQASGIDICSIRTMRQSIDKLNKEKFAGYNDWRLPSLEEGMSLMESSANFKGLYLNPCFSASQPFVFVNAKRKPGGYWFVDYKQGCTFWSSGTIPGGFGRLCRTVNK